MATHEEQMDGLSEIGGSGQEERRGYREMLGVASKAEDMEFEVGIYQGPHSYW